MKKNKIVNEKILKSIDKRLASLNTKLEINENKSEREILKKVFNSLLLIKSVYEKEFTITKENKKELSDLLSISDKIISFKKTI